jgi:alkylation response protein AidB-like acyl-CoA dehydrogenase
LDLDLSDDQKLFRDTTRRFLDTRWPMAAVRRLLDDPLGFDRDLWGDGAELGWTSMLVAEEHGGGSISGDGLRDLAVVVEELGRALTPGPTVPTNLVAAAIGGSGAEHLASEHLRGIASGQVVATWTPPPHRVAAERTAAGIRLRGSVAPVQDAEVADLLLVTAEIDGRTVQGLVPLPADGVVVQPLESLDLTRRYARVRFDAVELAESCVLPDPDLDHLLALALTLQCVESVGVAATALDFTLEYVQNRKAFGQPIGSFQVLKHRLAEHTLWLETSRAVTVEAVRATQAGVGGLDAARLAKAWVAERTPALLRDCLQMHGGIGFTWEHDVHLYLRRVDTNAAVYGGVGDQLDALASAVGF